MRWAHIRKNCIFRRNYEKIDSFDCPYGLEKLGHPYLIHNKMSANNWTERDGVLYDQNGSVVSVAYKSL